MPQWPEKFGINESHLSFFVIAALILEKEDIKDWKDTHFFSVEDKQGRKKHVEKTDSW